LGAQEQRVVEVPDGEWEAPYHFTEFTEAVNENTGGISKHRLSPYKLTI